jgi:hypothetical protein
MAEFTKGRHAFVGGVEIGGMHCHGEEAGFAFGRGTQIFPNLPVAIYGAAKARVVMDAGEKWFELGFGIDTVLSGNAAMGWMDAQQYLRIEPQWSSNLVTWAMGKFTPAPTPMIDLGGGNREYWSRAIHPVDSAVKSAQIRVKSGGSGGIRADSRNNPFTGLVVSGVALALGGFPYTMPGDAMRMQGDLQVFYPGSTVAAASNLAWEIIIPGVTTTAFGQTHRVTWPIYQAGTDFFGNPAYIWGADFAGEFVNSAGVAIFTHAFGRLKISAGTRYDPYL